MKKVISIAIVGVAGGVLFWATSSYKSVSPTATPVDVQVNLPSTESIVAEPPSAQIDQTTSRAPQQPQLTEADLQMQPHEMALINAWGEERGYDWDGRFTLSYESMDDETLQALADQHDPKAHLVLANRILGDMNVRNISPDRLSAAENHLYAASMLGYTETLDRLSEIMQRKSIFDLKSRKEFVLEAYKFAYVNELRGDFNSSVQLQLLKFSNPISAKEEKTVLANADNTYREFLQQRQGLGLPEFNNAPAPPEALAKLKRITNMIAKDYADMLTDETDFNKNR